MMSPVPQTSDVVDSTYIRTPTFARSPARTSVQLSGPFPPELPVSPLRLSVQVQNGEEKSATADAKETVPTVSTVSTDATPRTRKLSFSMRTPKSSETKKAAHPFFTEDQEEDEQKKKMEELFGNVSDEEKSEEKKTDPPIVASVPTVDPVQVEAKEKTVEAIVVAQPVEKKTPPPPSSGQKTGRFASCVSPAKPLVEPTVEPSASPAKSSVKRTKAPSAPKKKKKSLFSPEKKKKKQTSRSGSPNDKPKKIKKRVTPDVLAPIAPLIETPPVSRPMSEEDEEEECRFIKEVSSSSVSTATSSSASSTGFETPNPRKQKRSRKRDITSSSSTDTFDLALFQKDPKVQKALEALAPIFSFATSSKETEVEYETYIAHLENELKEKERRHNALRTRHETAKKLISGYKTVNKQLEDTVQTLKRKLKKLQKGPSHIKTEPVDETSSETSGSESD